MGFIDSVIEKARSNKKTIVLPESYEPRTIEACAKIIQKDIANVVLIGNREKIQAVSPQWDISAAKIVDPSTSDSYEDFVNSFYEMRKAKGMTLEKARTTMLDPLFYGVMMVKKQQADGMVAGAVNSTGQYPASCVADFENRPRHQTGIGFFYDDCAGL